MLRRSPLRAAVVAGAVVASALSLSACGGNDGKAASGSTTSGASATSASSGAAQPATTGECKYQPAAGEAAGGKAPGMPADPAQAVKTGTVKFMVKTNQGDIPLTLDRAKAPCTVQSFEHLVGKKFYDNTICHRIVEMPQMGVLQCGDPTGQGSGGPGYSFKDELKGSEKYPKGTLAMANAGPNTNGSQFFMVTKDTQLGPSYNVFGTVDPAGMKVLESIVKNGINAGPRGGQDGAPKKEVKITAITKG